MPRIPAAIAVVVLVATCIGFNTARFPVVLEMAAVPDTAPKSPLSTHSTTTTESEDSERDQDCDGNRDESPRKSGWSSYANDENETGSSYSSYRSYGSHDDDDDSSEAGDDEDETVDSSYSYSSTYGNKKDSTSSDDEEESSYGYGYDQNESSSNSKSYGYGGNDSSSYDESSSSEDRYGRGSGMSSQDDDTSATEKRSRRSKSKPKDQTSSEKKSNTTYGWQNNDNQDSDNYDPYGSSEPDSSPDESGSGSSSYSKWESPTSRQDKSSNAYAGDSAADKYGTSSYESKNSYENRSSYGNGNDYSSYDEDRDTEDESSNSYSENSSAREYGTGSYDDAGDPDEGGSSYRDRDAYGSRTPYAGNSSYNDRDSVTRYGERQEAAADNSSTWSGGASVTASPSGRYAYGSDPYAPSAAASAGAASKTDSLGLVPIEEDSQSSGTWGDAQPSYGRNDSSPYSGYSTQDRRSDTSPAPAGFTPLPPVDPSVQGPTLPPLTNGSIPVYRSTSPL